MVEGERYRSLQLQSFSYPLHRGWVHFDHPSTSPFPLLSPSSSLPQSPPPCQLLSAREGVKPCESTGSSCRPLFSSSTCILRVAADIQSLFHSPPTSNLCISKPSVAQDQPTPRIGSAQLVITDHNSSETSRFSLFRQKKKKKS